MASSLQPEPDFRSNELFEWVDNMPRPRASKAMQRDQVQQLYHAAGGLPYRGVWNPDTQTHEIEERFRGASNFEVMVMKEVEEAVRADGGSARSRVIDRVLGKPKQAVESTTMTMSYSEFLDQMAQQGYTDGVIDLSPDPAPPPAPAETPMPFRPQQLSMAEILDGL